MPDPNFISRRFKVMHIASGDLWAGAEVMLHGLASHQVRSIDVAVVVLNQGRLAQELERLGVQTWVLDESTLGTATIAWRIHRLVRQWQPDVIHTHRKKENVLGALVGLLNAVPTVRTIHGAAEHLPGWWQFHKSGSDILDRLVGRLLQKRIVAVSSELEAGLAAMFGSGKVCSVTNGVDTDSIITASHGSKPLAPKPEDSIRMALVGRLVPVKRVDLFLATVATLQHNRNLKRRVEAFVIGEGPMRSEVEAFAERLGVAPFVMFTGALSTVVPHLAQMDVLLITSDHEGLPMVLLEALTLGIPVIAHDVGGIPSLSGEERLTLVRNHTVEGYAEAVMKLFADGLLSPSERSVRKAADLPWDVGRTAARYQEIYEGVRRRGRGARSDPRRPSRQGMT